MVLVLYWGFIELMLDSWCTVLVLYSSLLTVSVLCSGTTVLVLWSGLTELGSISVIAVFLVVTSTFVNGVKIDWAMEDGLICVVTGPLFPDY